MDPFILIGGGSALAAAIGTWLHNRQRAQAEAERKARLLEEITALWHSKPHPGRPAEPKELAVKPRPKSEAAVDYRQAFPREIPPPPPENGPRITCPFCGADLARKIKKRAETYWINTFCVPVACAPSFRLRTGFWPWSRCKIDNAHIHQGCSACKGTWVRDIDDPSAKESVLR